MMIQVAKTEMGGAFKKICSRADDSDSDNDSENTIDSPEEFYRYLRLELEDDEIYRLKYLFNSIKIVEHQVGRAFYKFVSTKKFKKKFRNELDRYRSRIHNDANLQGCLMDHCFAVIWVHLDILKAIQNSSAIHKLLYEIAACHIHFKDFGKLLEIHDALLFKFIKIEFDKYTNKFTLQSLYKYFKIISNRILAIKEEMERIEKASNIAQTVLHLQRTSLELRIKELNTLRQIYSGVRMQSSTNFFGNSSDKSKAPIADPSKLPKIESEILTNSFTDLQEVDTDEIECKAEASNHQEMQSPSSINRSMGSEGFTVAGSNTLHKADTMTNFRKTRSQSLMNLASNSQDFDTLAGPSTIHKTDARSNLKLNHRKIARHSSLINLEDIDESSATSKSSENLSQD